MHDIKNFSMKDLAECGIALRNMGNDSHTMEDVACKIVNYLYNNLSDKETGDKCCALVRLYKTHSLEGLEPELQQFALSMLNTQHTFPSLKCLTLLATAGEIEEWNSRKNSKGHKAIPLPSEKVVNAFPMISNLVKQLGIEIQKIIVPDPNIIMDLEQKAYNVFYVDNALDNPYIPAQEDFVIPFNIKSVLGFGGILPLGDMFAVIIFLKIKISKETADLFKSLSLNVKIAIMSFEDSVFME